MFFEEQSIGEVDKGLFTFYREQAQKEDQIRRNKKLKKQLKKMQQFQKNKQQVVVKPPKQLSPVKINTVRKVFSLKQYIKKQKLSHCKQRYVESIVNMGYLTQKQQNKSSIEKQKIQFKLKQPRFISKTKKYSQKLNQLKHSFQHQRTLLKDDILSDDLRIGPLIRKDDFVDVVSARMKADTHIMRNSFEMPEIRKSDQKINYKPKKTIKSKIILQALKMTDRDKIRNIRDLITGRTMMQFPLSEQCSEKDYFDKLETKVLQCGVFEIKGALSMLNRLKKRF